MYYIVANTLSSLVNEIFFVSFILPNNTDINSLKSLGKCFPDKFTLHTTDTSYRVMPCTVFEINK